MKFINFAIFACLLSFVLLLHGPNYDQQNRYNYKDSCAMRYVGSENSGLDEKDPNYVPFSKSDCVDRNLYNRNMPGNKYYDHCCYLRMQQEGSMYQGCVGLKEIDYLDIDETIFKIEKGVYKYWGQGVSYSGWPSTKVYDIQCNSSFIYISFAVIISLLGLML